MNENEEWAIIARQNLPHAWKGDVREPIFTFSLGGDHLYGFYFFSIVQNIEIALVRFLLLRSILG